MSTASQKTSSRAHAAKATPKAKSQVTTIRLDAAVHKGLQVLEAHSGVKRPLNKWVNIALAALIDRQAATLEHELDHALRQIKTYRKTDPGYRRAIRAFIDAEVAFARGDPMEGSRTRQAAGPALTMVRGMLRG